MSSHRIGQSLILKDPGHFDIGKTILVYQLFVGSKSMLGSPGDGLGMIWTCSVSCRVVSCRVVSESAVSRRIASCRIPSCRVASRRFVSRRAVSCRVDSRRDVSCRLGSRRVVSYRVASRRGVPDSPVKKDYTRS